MERPLLSVVVPAHNEEASLPALHRELAATLSGVTDDYELIVVDDGSTDGTSQAVRGLHRRDPRVSLIALAGNVGHQLALSAGLDAARGKAVVMMDADLQHPPSLIPDMVRLWRGGAMVVQAVRQEAEGEPWLKRAASRLYYAVFNALSESPVRPGASDFRLLDRVAVEALRSMKERRRMLRGMVGWLRLPEAIVYYKAPARAAGRSKYTWARQLRMAVDGLVAFSAQPLRLALWLGLGAVATVGAYAVYVLYIHFVTGAALKGWSSLVLLTSFIGGVQLVALGLIGEYLATVYDELKARPLYLVRETIPPRSRVEARAADER